MVHTVRRIKLIEQGDVAKFQFSSQQRRTAALLVSDDIKPPCDYVWDRSVAAVVNSFDNCRLDPCLSSGYSNSPATAETGTRVDLAH